MIVGNSITLVWNGKEIVVKIVKIVGNIVTVV